MPLGSTIRLLALGSVVTLGVSACTDSTTPSATGSGTAAPPTTAAAPSPAPDPSVDTPVTSVDALDPAIRAVMAKTPYAAGQWAIAVRDMDSGEQLIELNAHSLFQPGSVVKTYSAGAAWQRFGPDSTVVTPVKRTGDVVDRALIGDLILVGQGDLTLGGRTKSDGTVDFTDLDHNDANDIPGATLTSEDPLAGLDDLAAQVKSAGIDEIRGDVVVDDRLWQPHALSNGPVSPIIVNQNVIDVTTTATGPGELATAVMSPVVAPWTVDMQVRTVPAGGTTEIEIASPDERTLVLTGTIAADSVPVLKVHAFADPATFARTAFIEALQRAGVVVSADPVATNPVGSLPDTATVSALTAVAELTSLPLDQETTYVLKVSYNRGAETLICRLAVASGSSICTDGLASAAGIWRDAGLDPAHAVLIDGSGLPGNLITADSQVELQTIMAARPDAAAWKATLPILGVDGSLALVQAGSPARGKVVGKTGTLGAGDLFNRRLLLPTKALGGYIDAASGRRLAFAVIVVNSVFPDIEGVFAANDDVGAIVATLQQTY